MEKVNNIKNILLFNIIKSLMGLVVIMIFISLNLIDNADIFSDFQKNRLFFICVLLILWKITSFPFLNQKKMYLKFLISNIISVFNLLLLFFLGIVGMIFNIITIIYPISFIIFCVIDYLSNFYFPLTKYIYLCIIIFILLGVSYPSIADLLYNPFIKANSDNGGKGLNNFYENLYFTFFIIQTVTLNLCYYYKYKTDKNHSIIKPINITI